MRRLGYGLVLAFTLGAAALAPTALAQDLASARRFVTGLYSAYHGDGPDYLGRQAAAVFSPRMLALIRLDRARTPNGDVGALDGDPICDCQDFDKLRMAGLKIATPAQGRAVATVRLRDASEARTVTLYLVPSASGWRIDDIGTADTPSLAAFLRRHAGGRQD